MLSGCDTTTPCAWWDGAGVGGEHGARQAQTPPQQGDAPSAGRRTLSRETHPQEGDAVEQPQTRAPRRPVAKLRHARNETLRPGIEPGPSACQAEILTTILTRIAQLPQPPARTPHTCQPGGCPRRAQPREESTSQLRHQPGPRAGRGNDTVSKRFNEMDSKSSRLCPQGFKPPRCRFRDASSRRRAVVKVVWILRAGAASRVGRNVSRCATGVAA